MLTVYFQIESDNRWIAVRHSANSRCEVAATEVVKIRFDIGLDDAFTLASRLMPSVESVLLRSMTQHTQLCTPDLGFDLPEGEARLEFTLLNATELAAVKHNLSHIVQESLASFSA